LAKGRSIPFFYEAEGSVKDHHLKLSHADREDQLIQQLWQTYFVRN
jgi:hypothetical protein